MPKTEQLDATVAWCIQNGSRGYAALKTGKFPLIKDHETINNCLDRKIVTGEMRSYCTILTSNEEKSIVHFVKNKNRCSKRMVMLTVWKCVVLNQRWGLVTSWRTHQLICLMFPWLYILAMSRMPFRVNPHSSCLNVKELLAQSRCKIWS